MMVRFGAAGGMLFASALMVASCAQVLGDVQVEERPLSTQETDRSAVSTGPAVPTGGGSETNCESGATRCRDQYLEICVRWEPGRPTGWLIQEDCFSPELCVESPDVHCIARSCDRQQMACAGAVPRVCNAAQNGWDELPACASEAHCSTNPASCPAGAPCCLDAPCTAGEMRCNEGEMQRCNASETGWDSVALCETPDLCLGGLADCNSAPGGCQCQTPECDAGAMRCTGPLLERCNAGRTGWEVIETCATDALCSLGLSLGAACQPPACEIGAHVCSEGGLLQGCRVDRTGFDAQEQCEGPPFCDAVAGECRPAPCQPGEQRCNGVQVEICLEDQTGFRPLGAPCATPALCNDRDPTNVHCDPPQCAVNEFNCFQGAQLQVCNEGRTGFVNAGPPCLRPDLCSAERRRCDFCFPGRQECTPELDATRVCSVSGNFFGPETFCPLGCVGPLGTCQTCQIGSYRCNGNIIARCNDGFSFTPLNRSTDCSGATQFTCGNGLLTPVNCGAPGCSAVRALCNECTGQQRQCSGAGFRECVGGLFSATQQCPGGLTCRGAGTCGCEPGSLRCSGDTLQACNPLGTAFAAAPACGGEDGDILRLCDDGELESIDCGPPDSCDDGECDD